MDVSLFFSTCRCKWGVISIFPAAAGRVFFFSFQAPFKSLRTSARDFWKNNNNNKKSFLLPLNGTRPGWSCLCAPPTPASTACLWGVGWITEGFQQDFTDKKDKKNFTTIHGGARLLHQPIRVPQTWQPLSGVYMHFCVSDCNKAPLRHVWTEGEWLLGVSLLKQHWPTFPKRQRYTTWPLDTPLYLEKTLKSDCCSTKSSSKTKVHQGSRLWKARGQLVGADAMLKILASWQWHVCVVVCLPHFIFHNRDKQRLFSPHWLVGWIHVEGPPNHRWSSLERKPCSWPQKSHTQKNTYLQALYNWTRGMNPRFGQSSIV